MWRGATDGDLDYVLTNSLGATLVTNLMTDSDPAVAQRVFAVSTPATDTGGDFSYSSVCLSDVTR